MIISLTLKLSCVETDKPLFKEAMKGHKGHNLTS